MTTTIQISEELQSKLAKRKIFDRETYEEIIWDLLEDTIDEARKEVAKGKVYTLDQVKKEAGLQVILLYQILFSEKAKKQFLKLAKDIQKRIINSLDRIKIRPEAYVKKLVGEISHRLRVGDYRVIMDIDKGKLIILVIKVGHRKNIYK